LIFLTIYISGNYDLFSNSYKRVVNYNTAFEPPAPFEFLILNKDLKAIENNSFDLFVKTVGDIIPEEIEIHFDNNNYFLQSIGSNSYKFSFDQTKDKIKFYLTANNVTSREYTIDILKVPSLIEFEMELDYPSYTKKKDESIKSTGNAIIPEGTRIHWKVTTRQTEKVELLLNDTVYNFIGTDNNFQFSKRLHNDLDYEIGTSNTLLERYERLGFSIEVIKDKYPVIEMSSKLDTLTTSSELYFLGQVSDDYGLSKLELIYYPQGEEENYNNEKIKIDPSSYSQFTYVFPGTISLKDGIDYEFYFQITDNDAVNGGKKSKSRVFNFRKLTSSELENEQLKKQDETIKGLDKTLDKLKNQEKELDKISKNQKEKNSLNFNDKKKLQNFLQRQKQQEQLRKNFTKELKDNLEDFQKENIDDEFKKLLKERLEREQKELEQNEKLLDEIEKLTDKINKQELARKLEKLAKQQQNGKRSLEQILELTKRYFVTSKASKLQQDIEELSKEQDSLSNKKEVENSKEKQDNLNDKFDKLKKELEELKKSNEELKKPLDIKRDQKSENEIDKEQKEASENLDKSKKSNEENKKQQAQKSAKKNQKKAAKKLKELSKSLQQQIQQGGQEGESEDAETLRQILDNLVLFSFDQENVLSKFSELDNSNASFASELRKQNDLRELFKHIDDSLFALSLRRPEISEKVNKEITNVYFNIDKSLERLAQNRIGEGVASQQYALTAANNLAEFLSQVLDNMQQSLGNGQGQGNKKSKGFQLPDLIQSQEEINKQFEEGLKKKNQGKPGEGKEGKKGKEGEKGQEGNKGKDGNGSKEGDQGSEGSGGDEGYSKELYEIFKQQQQLRLALEEQLKDKLGKGGENGNADKLLKELENIENDLINNGFTERTLQKLTELKHQLLKLENANFEQGEKKERESKTNFKEYKNTINNQDVDIKQYFKQIEILNRQVLPLRQIYKKKVQSYFKGND